MKCPYCGWDATCDEVDIGVGNIQCGPYGCERCGAVKIGMNDDRSKLTKAEENTGWYEPTERETTILDHSDERAAKDEKYWRDFDLEGYVS